jgi:hypothetical protein
MGIRTRVAVVAALIVSCAGGVRAESYGGSYGFQPQELTDRTPLPGPSLVAATTNILYMPARLAVSIVSAELGGATGFLLAGDADAASDVWGVFEGQSILTQDIVQGKERLRLGYYEYQLEMITPVE